MFESDGDMGVAIVYKGTLNYFREACVISNTERRPLERSVAIPPAETNACVACTIVVLDGVIVTCDGVWVNVNIDRWICSARLNKSNFRHGYL